MAMPDEATIHMILCGHMTSKYNEGWPDNANTTSVFMDKEIQTRGWNLDSIVVTENTNLTTTPSSVWNATAAASTEFHGKDLRQQLTQILYEKVVVVICCLGILGNLLNLLVLTKKSLLYTLGRMEKFVYAGLISLALSDMIFCLAIIPHAFIEELGITSTLTFSQVYHAYSNGVINTLIMSSTWLTVTMTIGRYYVMCHPFRAREVIGLTFAARAMIIVFVLCLVFNIPRFWISKIAEVHCSDDVQYYYVRHGYVRENEHMYKVYMWLYFTACILLPLIVLTCCNVALIRALRNSVRTRKSIRHSGASSSSHLNNNGRITLTLIIIVMMYILLVCPAELIVFVQEMTPGTASNAVNYNLAVAVVNTLQALNFALNFILYCVMNSHFRRTMTYLMQCRGRGIINLGQGRRRSTSYRGSCAIHSTILSRSSSRSSSYHVMTSMGRHPESPIKLRAMRISEC